MVEGYSSDSAKQNPPLNIPLDFDSAVGGLLKVDPTQVPPPNKRPAKKAAKKVAKAIAKKKPAK